MSITRQITIQCTTCASLTKAIEAVAVWGHYADPYEAMESIQEKLHENAEQIALLLRERDFYKERTLTSTDDDVDRLLVEVKEQGQKRQWRNAAAHANALVQQCLELHSKELR